ncbi:glutathione S-transferase [Apiospora kogelbergensis]|uniref:Glutathione S-transferase n=1 Tax=Apiospora kogelbergensis TaxID=1337665 RepID=A0AAW0RB47_9PEZI
MVLTVHHLQVSQSERIPWLCEELGISYELKNYQRAPALAPPEYKALHWTGSAPVITDDDGNGGVLTLAESGACVQYICEKHGGGKLFPTASHPLYADFLYWFHWTNGTFTPTIGRAGMVPDGKDDGGNPMVAFYKQKRQAMFQGLDDRLATCDWLAGNEFTAADVMLVFTLTTFRYFSAFDLGAYPHILTYLQRVGAREGYQRAMKKADPDMKLVLGAEAPESFFKQIKGSAL